MSAFTEGVLVLPAYDYRDDPQDGRGAHGAALVLILRGSLGAISAEFMTGWMINPLAGRYVRSVGKQRRRTGVGVDAGIADVYPSGAYVGSHIPTIHGDPCKILGQECRGDGSYTLSDQLLELLVAEGSDAVFERMRELYQDWIVAEVVS